MIRIKQHDTNNLKKETNKKVGMLPTPHKMVTSPRKDLSVNCELTSKIHKQFPLLPQPQQPPVETSVKTLGSVFSKRTKRKTALLQNPFAKCTTLVELRPITQ